MTNGGPARPLHEPGNHRSSERCSHRHSADCGSLIERPTLLRMTAPTPRLGGRSSFSDSSILPANKNRLSLVVSQIGAGSSGAPVPLKIGLRHALIFETG